LHQDNGFTAAAARVVHAKARSSCRTVFTDAVQDLDDLTGGLFGGSAGGSLAKPSVFSSFFPDAVFFQLPSTWR
jgi:hypothetical protein